MYLPNVSVNIYIINEEGNFIAQNTRNKLEYINNEYILTTLNQSKYIYNTNGILYKVIDKYGNEINLNLDQEGNIISLVDNRNRAYSIEYSQGKIVKIIDPLNREVSYLYDENGMLSQVIGVNGKSIYYEYDESKCLINIKEENDNLERIVIQNIVYDEVDKGRVFSVTNANGKKDIYTYEDDYTLIQDQNGRITRKNYDEKGYVTKITNPSGEISLFSYNLIDGINKYGEIIQKIDDTGNVHIYTRDEKGNVAIETNGGKTRRYTYNDKNNVTRLENENGIAIEYEYADDGITLLSEKYIDGTTKKI